MPIVKYFDQDIGKELFKVRVCRRSKNHKGVYVDRRAQGFKTHAEAVKAERQIRIELEQELLDAENRTNRWELLVNEWELAARNGDIFIRSLTKYAIDDYFQVLMNHTKEWMNLPVLEIDRAKAWILLDKIDREISIARRKKVRTAIDAVFKWAMLSGRLKNLSSVPTEGFRSTKTEEEKMPEILNLAQIRTLLTYAQKVEHPWFPIWALALFTGMRSGELYALEWEQVDFDNKLIYVHRNWTSKGGFGPTKGRYWRAVPVESEQVLTLLKELKLKAKDGKFVLHHFQSWTDGGQAMILREFCQGSGLPSVKFHTLRACFATQLIRDSVAPAVVMKICGWKDLKTMQRYIRLAGIEVKGATQGLKLLPEREVMGRVVNLFSQK